MSRMKRQVASFAVGLGLTFTSASLALAGTTDEEVGKAPTATTSDPSYTQSAPWPGYRLVSSTGCIELWTNGTFNRWLGVCTKYNSHPLTNLNLSGHVQEWCIPKGATKTYLRAESSWTGKDKWPNGCSGDGDRDGIWDAYVNAGISSVPV